MSGILLVVDPSYRSDASSLFKYPYLAPAISNKTTAHVQMSADVFKMRTSIFLLAGSARVALAQPAILSERADSVCQTGNGNPLVGTHPDTIQWFSKSVELVFFILDSRKIDPKYSNPI